MENLIKNFEIIFVCLCIVSILMIINYRSIKRYENRLLVLGLLLVLLLGYSFVVKNNNLIQSSSILTSCKCSGGGYKCIDSIKETWSDINKEMTAVKSASVHKLLSNDTTNDTTNDATNDIREHSLMELTGPYSNKVLSQYNCNSMIYQGSSNPMIMDAHSRTNSNDCPEEFAFDGSGKVYDCKDISKPYTSKNNEDSLLMFSCNMCSPNCCPSNYTCPGGCVCTTPEQKKLIQNRGTNNLRLEPENMMS